MRWIVLFCTLLASAAARGQIVVPPSTEPYRILTAKVSAGIPEGATIIAGGWKVSEGVSFLEHDASTIHLTATPGEHDIAYSGYWVHTKPVTFKDGDGNTVTINSYLGSGEFENTAKFTVLGGAAPDPKPDPPEPVPGGPKKIVCFLKADELDKPMPYAQRYIVTSRVARKNLSDRGHDLLIIDDSEMQSPPPEYAPWVAAVSGQPLPCIAIASLSGGPISCFPMPVDYKHLLTLLGEPTQ